ncbi:MAG: cutinase family protein [Mycobacterium sp.]|uniref:cutinase family protein n=1 Tax=Mycobacterium sp. TaxID=1785 RepID=UPI003BAEE51A
MTWAVLGVSIPSASAEGCPDVEAIFARGTTEAPGVGGIGQAFVDSLQSKVGSKSFGVYAVDYPATTDFPTAVDGIRDAGNHVESMAAICPKTKLVLGGYSQGAAVMGFLTPAAIPDGVDPATVPKPMDADVANHVSSVVLFAMPNGRAMDFLGEPAVDIGPLYQAKTIKVCAPEDPVCSDGMNFSAHDTYAGDGAMIDKGAAFAASHLDDGSSGPTTVVTSPSRHGGFGS